MTRRGLLAAAGWLLTAVTTAALTTAALDNVGVGLLGPSSRTLSAAEVARELDNPAAVTPHRAGPSRRPLPDASGAATPDPAASAPLTETPKPTPGGPTKPTATSPGASRYLTTTGGTILARCTGDVVQLTSWSPAQGYRVDGDVHRGPAQTAQIKFASGTTGIRVTVICVNGGPTARSEPYQPRSNG